MLWRISFSSYIKSLDVFYEFYFIKIVMALFSVEILNLHKKNALSPVFVIVTAVQMTSLLPKHSIFLVTFILFYFFVNSAENIFSTIALLVCETLYDTY